MEIIDKVLTKIEDKDLIDGELILTDVEEIKESVFENNKFILKIDAPSLKKINLKAFYNCINLKEFNAPLLEYIGEYAFFNTSLTNFDFNSVIEISEKAFEKSRLNTIYLPRTIKNVGASAFSNNQYLVKVNFQANITIIRDNMFENCSNLKEITFSNSINKIGIGSFKNCKKIINIDLPEHLKIIETNAFWGCENLKTVKIDNELEFINDYAFGDTKLVNIDLPDSVESLGMYPFHMCYQLEHLKIKTLYNDNILDKTNSKLKELIIKNEKVDILKTIKKIINYNNLIVVKYNDDSFQILAKPIKCYNKDYFEKKFPNSNIKLLMKNDSIFNIYYWESILEEEILKKLNPVAFIALPPNINMIKAYSKKYQIYEDLINKNEITEFNNLVAIIKFITIFGGLNKKNYFNLDLLIKKIGIRNISKQFVDTNVKEFNQNFVKIYTKLSEDYNYKEISSIMPFLYNNIEKVINLKDNITIDTLELLKFEDNIEESALKIEVKKSETNIPNYEWLDTTSITNLLWGYILGSVSERNIDTNEQTRKVATYNIKDENGMIVATSRAFYSVEEKYLLFNSIILTQSFINKNYKVEEIKSMIIDYVLDSITEVLNFLNEEDLVVTKVNVGISEKNIMEQLMNNGTKVITQNL